MATNALELVPALRRQVSVYTKGANTNDSALAGYIFDAIQALMIRWNRTYTLTFISPATYNVTPTVEPKDIRPIILMASIIYKSGAISVANFTDGDFSWHGQQITGSIDSDRTELLLYVPKMRLAVPSAGKFLGFKSIYNPENYDWAGTLQYVWGA